MANYPYELAQNAACQSHTGLWFLPNPAKGLNNNYLQKLMRYGQQENQRWKE
jgi:hypothetical protein